MHSHSSQPSSSPRLLGLFLSLLLAASTAVSASDDKEAPPVRFDPIVQSMEGWTIYVDPALLNDGADAELGTKTLRMLADHLNRISILVPPDRLEKMQTLHIWIESNHPSLDSMQYHPDVGWLKKHRHDPRLAKMVHIPQAKALLSRDQLLKHPAVVLHELAHAYHDQILGWDDPDILRVYNAAKEKGIYENVLLYTGKRVNHYGLNNHKEYFAEGTEAYFYRNDFYPFVRAELAEHDPEFHIVLENIWGPAR